MSDAYPRGARHFWMLILTLNTWFLWVQCLPVYLDLSSCLPFSPFALIWGIPLYSSFVSSSQGLCFELSKIYFCLSTETALPEGTDAL